MPTVTPLPSTPKAARAPAALSCASPSELTERRRSRRRETSGASTSVDGGDPGHRAEARRSAGATATVTVW